MKPKQVLVVDDSLDLQGLLESILTRAGYTVHCADDGRQALEWLKSCNDLPGVIMLDLMMPDMDGYQFREAQVLDPRLAAIPIIVMTADRDLQSIKTKIDAHAHIRKPFLDMDIILQTVSRFF